jgi:hypothetical protein
MATSTWDRAGPPPARIYPRQRRDDRATELGTVMIPKTPGARVGGVPTCDAFPPPRRSSRRGAGGQPDDPLRGKGIARRREVARSRRRRSARATGDAETVKALMRVGSDRAPKTTSDREQDGLRRLID